MRTASLTRVSRPVAAHSSRELQLGRRSAPGRKSPLRRAGFRPAAAGAALTLTLASHLPRSLHAPSDREHVGCMVAPQISKYFEGVLVSNTSMTNNLCRAWAVRAGHCGDCCGGRGRGRAPIAGAAHRAACLPRSIAQAKRRPRHVYVPCAHASPANIVRARTFPLQKPQVEQGYKMYLTMGGTICYGSNNRTVADLKSAKESECNTTCPGDSRETCGGDFKYQIYTFVDAPAAPGACLGASRAC